VRRPAENASNGTRLVSILSGCGEATAGLPRGYRATVVRDDPTIRNATKCHSFDLGSQPSDATRLTTTTYLQTMLPYTGWRRINRATVTFNRVYENLPKITLLTLAAHRQIRRQKCAFKYSSVINFLSDAVDVG